MSQSVCMAIDITSKRKADTSTGRYRLVSGRALLESTHLGVLNSVNLDGRACSCLKGDKIQ